MQPRILLDFFATRTHCWLMVSFLSTRILRSFYAELLSRQLTTGMYWCLGSFIPRSRTLHYPLLNSMRFLLAQFSSLSKSLQMMAQPCGISAAPPSSVPSVNRFAHGMLSPIIQIANEDVEQDWPQHQPLGYTTTDWPPT